MIDYNELDLLDLLERVYKHEFRFSITGRQPEKGLELYCIRLTKKDHQEIVNALKGVKPNRDELEMKPKTGPRVSVPLAPRPDPELA